MTPITPRRFAITLLVVVAFFGVVIGIGASGNGDTDKPRKPEPTVEPNTPAPTPPPETVEPSPPPGDNTPHDEWDVPDTGGGDDHVHVGPNIHECVGGRWLNACV